MFSHIWCTSNRLLKISAIYMSFSLLDLVNRPLITCSSSFEVFPFFFLPGRDDTCGDGYTSCDDGCWAEPCVCCTGLGCYTGTEDTVACCDDGESVCTASADETSVECCTDGYITSVASHSSIPLKCIILCSG